MYRKLRQIWLDGRGDRTDWVVLTAVLLGVATVVLASIQAGPQGLAWHVVSTLVG
jgi:hypothetical protein